MNLKRKFQTVMRPINPQLQEAFYQDDDVVTQNFNPQFSFLKLLNQGTIKKQHQIIKRRKDFIKKELIGPIKEKVRKLQRNRQFVYQNKNVPIPQAITQIHDQQVRQQMQKWFKRAFVHKYQINSANVVKVSPIWRKIYAMHMQALRKQRQTRQRQQEQFMKYFKQGGQRKILSQDVQQHDILFNQSFGLQHFGTRQQPIIQKPVIQQQPSIKRSQNIFTVLRQNKQQQRRLKLQLQKVSKKDVGFGIKQKQWLKQNIQLYQTAIADRFFNKVRVKWSIKFLQLAETYHIDGVREIIMLRNMVQKQFKKSDAGFRFLARQFSALISRYYPLARARKVFGQIDFQKSIKLVRRQAYWSLPVHMVGFNKQYGIGTTQQLQKQKQKYVQFIYPTIAIPYEVGRYLQYYTLAYFKKQPLLVVLAALRYLKILIQLTFLNLMSFLHVKIQGQSLNPLQQQKQVQLLNRRLYINLRQDANNMFTVKQLFYTMVCQLIKQGLDLRSKNQQQSIGQSLLGFSRRIINHRNKATVKQDIQKSLWQKSVRKAVNLAHDNQELIAMLLTLNRL